MCFGDITDTLEGILKSVTAIVEILLEIFFMLLENFGTMAENMKYIALIVPLLAIGYVAIEVVKTFKY
jgi:hypothetical protein